MKTGFLFVSPGYTRVEEALAWAKTQGLSVIEVREHPFVREPVWVSKEFLSRPILTFDWLKV